jgi:hypothetical protein
MVLAGTAAFCAYFAMYGFRKPFAVSTWESEPGIGAVELKTVLIVAQLAGYTASKFLGIRVCSGEGQRHRGRLLIGLILFAEAALLLLPLLPGPWKLLAMFLNGLPLGMVWGLVVSYLEGRRAADWLMAMLSCSFILSSGAVKDAGRWVLSQGVPEAWMPAATGALFIVPLVLAVALLERTPPPDAQDISERSERSPMTPAQRLEFVRRFGPGLAMLIGCYLVLTAYRDVRDNFAVEVLAELGALASVAAFTRTELPVTLGVIGAMGLLSLVRDNRSALTATFVTMAGGMALLGLSTLAHQLGWISGVTWIVLTGLGAYAAYVPFNAVLFERVVAATRSPGNAVFAIYLADAFGYLGAVTVQVGRDVLFTGMSPTRFLTGFSYVLSALGTVLFVCAMVYFVSKLRPKPHDKAELRAGSVVA